MSGDQFDEELEGGSDANEVAPQYEQEWIWDLYDAPQAILSDRYVLPEGKGIDWVEFRANERPRTVPPWAWDLLVDRVRSLPAEEAAQELHKRLGWFIDRYHRQPTPIRTADADRLTRRQWEAVALLCHRRLTPEQAADIMGCSPGTVSRHLEEAAKALGMTAKELRRRGFGIL